MGEGQALLLELIVVLATALVMGILTERLKQSPILGYMLAGMLLGPSAASLVTSIEVVRGLAEIGVAMLVFTVGLEFSWRRLVRMGWTIAGATIIQVVATTAAAYGICRWVGVPSGEALALGAICSVGSTAVVVRVLQERREIDSILGRTCVGMLLVQDLAVVGLVMLLAVVGGAGWEVQSIGEVVGQGILTVALFTIVLGRLLPKVMDIGLVGRNRELPVLLAVTICLGAAWATEATGLSPALGAFIAGMLLSDTRYADQIRADVAPFKTVFVTVFFASVGMLMDLRWTMENWALVLSVSALIIVGKALVTFASIRPFQSSIVYALGTGLALAQLGEFSFVLAQTAQTSGLLTPYGFQLVVSCTVLTLLASPYLVALASRVSHTLSARIPHKLAPKLGSTEPATRLSGHAVVVGYGNAGQAAVGELLSRGVDVAIIELHTKSLESVRRDGLGVVVVGDGAHESVLIAAGIERAACAIVAVPDPKTARQVLAAVKHVAPEIKTVVRSRYHAMLGEFLALGADRVVDEEKITGRRLAKYAWDIAFDQPQMDVSLR